MSAARPTRSARRAIPEQRAAARPTPGAAASASTGSREATQTLHLSKTNTPATGAPAISGTHRVGETLRASTGGIADADGLSNVSYSYEWIRVDGTTETAIGETASTYGLTGADEGKRVKVEVAFTDDLGFAETRSASVAVRAAGVQANLRGASARSGRDGDLDR